MIPKYYEFQHAAKVLSGDFALENIAGELRHLGSSRPMILTDRGIEAAGGLQIVADAMEHGGVSAVYVETDVPSDSSLSRVESIAAAFRAHACDGIVAVGGGSVIDTAKGMRMLLSQNCENIADVMGCETLSRGAALPFIAVPTTSGTGSESTIVAVIKDTVRNVKMEFISHYLQPDVAVLDLRMTEKLPARLTAATGMDALCHAIEAYTCLQKNPLSDAYAITAIRLIAESLLTAVAKPGEREARMAMANASMMAGAAFSNSMVGIVHAIGHSLGGVCGVPHANAMAILLPYGMRYNLPQCGALYGELLLQLAGPDAYASTPAAQRGEAAIDAVCRLRQALHDACGLPLTLREAGVDEAQLPAVAAQAIDDGALMVNPRAAGKEQILGILREAMG